jgi:hypothetical protein
VIGGEIVRQQSRLHWAIADNASFVFSAPGDFLGGGIPANQRERWLQGIHMPDGFAPLKEWNGKVRDSRQANLALFDQPNHLSPGILNRGTRLVRPMKLVKVNSLRAEPA